MKRTLTKHTPKILLAIAFSIVIICFLSYEHIFKFIHRWNNYYSVTPHGIGIVFYYLLLTLICIILLVCFYKLKEKKKKKNNNMKILICLILFFGILITAFTNCKSINYINKNEIYHNSQYIKNSSINKICIYIDRNLYSYPGSAMFHEYNIVCEIYTDTDELMYYSNDFYSYKHLYEFLCECDNATIERDNTLLDELISYEKNIILNNIFKSNDVSYVEKIFEKLTQGTVLCVDKIK